MICAFGKNVNYPNVPKSTATFAPGGSEPFIGRLIGKGIRFFDIEKDKFYYIVENEEEEEWEVHVEKIN